jgi:hypothetical protein
VRICTETFGDNSLLGNALPGGTDKRQKNARFSYSLLRRLFWVENRPENPFRKSKSGSGTNGEFSCTAKP